MKTINGRHLVIVNIQNGKAIVCLQPYALVGQGGQYRILGLKLK